MTSPRLRRALRSVLFGRRDRRREQVGVERVGARRARHRVDRVAQRLARRGVHAPHAGGGLGVNRLRVVPHVVRDLVVVERHAEPVDARPAGVALILLGDLLPEQGEVIAVLAPLQREHRHRRALRHAVILELRRGDIVATQQ